MKTFDYTITDPIGIHARPAGQLVMLAKKFTSTVTIEGNGKSANAKKMIAVMSLGIKQGYQVQVSCDGEDEESAITELQTFFKEQL